jgi:hypothetical protein
VDLLFAAFVAVQVAYLFGGEQNIHIEGYTYAAYARRGFFELLTVAVLSLALVQGQRRLTAATTAIAARWLNVLATVLAGLVLVILASAFQRLALYEAAYGYTTLRVYSHVFMVALATLFAWLSVTLWWRPERFAIGAFVAMLGFLAALNALDPDRFIAERNLERYAQNGDIDVDYLARLSVDALPVLAPAAARLPSTEFTTLSVHLRREVEQLDEPEYRGWPSLHLARLRARRLLP